MGLSNERNNPGILKGYRNRLIRRAKTVAELPSYRERIRETRRAWHNKYPRIRIHTFETFEEWGGANGTMEHMEVFGFVLLPKGSRDYRVNRLGPDAWAVDFTWIDLINEICQEFWPARFFPKQMNWDLRGNLTHPSYKFVEACMYCEITEIAARASMFFPEFRIHLQYLPYVPQLDDRWQRAVTEGERDAWKELALMAISHWAKKAPSEEQVRGLEEQARRIGIRRAQESGFSVLDDLERPDEEMFWYLPVSQQMSVTDVESAIPDVVEMSRRLTGPNFLDEMVLQLKAEGTSNEAVADLLGCSLNTVKVAVKRSKHKQRADSPDKTTRPETR